MTAEPALAPISHPSTVRRGAVIARVQKAGERVYEEWKVIGWQTPERPAPGQSWGSGFLVLEGCEEWNAGERLQVGPSKAVIRDFRQIVEEHEAPGEVITKQSRGPYWWERD